MRDVVVVGGGPVGLAAAIAARLAGLEVAVVEARRPPIDKACGEGLMPAGAAALAALGVEPRPLGQPFTGIRYVAAAGEAAAADFPRGALGYGVRRTALHDALRGRAEAVGVELRFGERAEALLATGGVRTAAGELAARFVVGADGLRSRVRGWAGLDGPASRRQLRFGVRHHLARAEPAPARVEVLFGRGAEAYLTPLPAGELGVALLWSGPARGFDDLVASRFPPALAARLAGAERRSSDRGAGPFHVRARAAARGRVALVGDAAGYLDAITGEGLSLGFREAHALARALAAGDLDGYAREAARLRRLPEAITRLALVATGRPALGRRLVRALAAEPAAFAALLGALGAAEPARSLARPTLLRALLRLALPSPGR